MLKVYMGFEKGGGGVKRQIHREKKPKSPLLAQKVIELQIIGDLEVYSWEVLLLISVRGWILN